MKFLNTLLFSLFTSLCFSQINISQYDKLYKENSKASVIYFYTDWCGICKIQEKQIYTNQALKKQLDEEVYFLKINGEDENNLTFLNNIFKTNSTQKLKANHELVKTFFSPQEINYPLWVILNKNQEIVGKYSGLIKSKNLTNIINQLNKEAK